MLGQLELIITDLFAADESDSGVGLCGWLLTMISWGLVLVTLPFSLCVCFKVVQEYERAVIFRLGRLLHGGSRGPGTSMPNHHCRFRKWTGLMA